MVIHLNFSFLKVIIPIRCILSALSEISIKSKNVMCKIALYTQSIFKWHLTPALVHASMNVCMYYCVPDFIALIVYFLCVEWVILLSFTIKSSFFIIFLILENSLVKFPSMSHIPSLIFSETVILMICVCNVFSETKKLRDVYISHHIFHKI